MSATGFYSERRAHDVVRARGVITMLTTQRETGSAQDLGSPQAKTIIDPDIALLNTTRIVAPDLYADSEGSSPVLINALRFLASAVQCLAESLQAANDGDAIQSDLQVQALRPLLRKLFMFRELGDGFGAVIDALISALDNNRGAPLDVHQLVTLRRTLLTVLQQPFLSFGDAINAIENIESAGFSTIPPGFEQLAEWLTVEGIS